MLMQTIRHLIGCIKESALNRLDRLQNIKWERNFIHKRETGMSYNVTKNRLEKQQIYDIVRHTFGKDTEVNSYTELLDGFCNTAYRIKLSDGREVVLKAAPKNGIVMMSCEQGMMQTEVRAMTLARQKGMEGVPIVYAFEENSFLSGSSYFIMECLEGDSYAAIKQKLTEEEQQTIDCEETNDQYVWVHGLFEKVWEEMEV